MTLFPKSISRRALQQHQVQEYHKEVDDTCISLTVWRKSLVFSCNGFTVIDSSGDLVFRVDNYTLRPEQVLLMDGSGKPVLTLCRRKRLGVLLGNWLVYQGEVGGDSSNEPICCVRKHVKILQPTMRVLASVYHGTRSSDKRKRCAYVVEGSYGQRLCRVLDESRRVVAEIKRKEMAGGGVSFGLEVFLLIVRPGFDPGLAMAIVLLLDQMFS